VIWGGEFGRTPPVELPTPGANSGKLNGRDHNHYGFSMWLAGGGVKGGQVYGATDEFGFQAMENKVHVHDLHATILDLMGIDHERLTYRYGGRDYRLTDVSGRVVRETVVSVFGNAVPGARTFFALPPLAEGESYQLTVTSFDLISRESSAPESP